MTEERQDGIEVDQGGLVTRRGRDVGRISATSRSVKEPTVSTLSVAVRMGAESCPKTMCQQRSIQESVGIRNGFRYTVATGDTVHNRA